MHSGSSMRGGAPTRGIKVRTVKFCIGIATICIIVAAIGVGAAKCAAPSHTPMPIPSDPAEFVSPYDWSGLKANGDRLSYTEHGWKKSQVGIDVSTHQGAIDWKAVSRDGIDFAFVRIGYRGYTDGMITPDDYFEANIEGAADAGLDVGAYFFSQCTSVDEAREEAQFAIDMLDGRKLKLPVVFDHEPIAGVDGRANDIDSETLTACADVFCEMLENAGYSTMIYGNAHDMGRYDFAALGDRQLWLAEYTLEPPSARLPFAIWQYSNTGSVNGIDGEVDLDLRMTEAI